MRVARRGGRGSFIARGWHDVPDEQALAEMEREMALSEAGGACVDRKAAHVGAEARVEPVLIPKLLNREEGAGERGDMADVSKHDAVTS